MALFGAFVVCAVDVDGGQSGIVACDEGADTEGEVAVFVCDDGTASGAADICGGIDGTTGDGVFSCADGFGFCSMMVAVEVKDEDRDVGGGGGGGRGSEGGEGDEEVEEGGSVLVLVVVLLMVVLLMVVLLRVSIRVRTMLRVSLLSFMTFVT